MTNVALVTRNEGEFIDFGNPDSGILLPDGYMPYTAGATSNIGQIVWDGDSFRLNISNAFGDRFGEYDLSFINGEGDILEFEGRVQVSDTLRLGTATTGDDELYGSNANDIWHAFAGNDLMKGGKGDDRLYGDDGNDALYGGNDNDELYGGTGDDRLYGELGNDKLYADVGNDQLFGQDGNDILNGGGGNDTMKGGNGNDELTGGGGKDIMEGNAGADTFVFKSVSESPTGQPTMWDVIKDFTRADGDLIDLSGIDANSNFGGDQAFTFIGNGSYTGQAGQLTFSDGFLSGDVNGDAQSDFTIEIKNITDLFANDFIL